MHSTKRRYQEKKEVLNSHKNTEEVLTGQATQLMEVADKASTDTYLLHDTIKRRKFTEHQITEACEKLDDSMNGHLNGMTTELQSFPRDFSQQTKHIIEKLSKYYIFPVLFICMSILNHKSIFFVF